MKHSILFSHLFCYLTACTLVIPDCYPLLQHTEKITQKFISATSKTDQLQLFLRGSHTDSEDRPIIWIGATKFDLLTIDETRILLVSKTEQLLRMISSYEAIHLYLDCYPETIKHLKFNIIFTTKTGAYPDEPYVAHASVNEEKVYYNLGEGRKLVLQEPYGTALQWVKENAPWVLEQD